MVRRWFFGASGTIACLLTVGAAPAVPARPAVPRLRISLAPQLSRSGRSIDKVAVALAFDSAPVAVGQPVVSLDVIADNVDTVATQVDVLRGRDERGPLTLVPRSGKVGGNRRDWIARRPVSGNVRISYTVAAHPVRPPRGPAPPIDASNDASAFSAGGAVLLLLPPDRERAYDLTIDWDLAHAGTGAAGVSSFGSGDVHPPRPLRLEDVRSTFFMAGRIGRWPDGEGSGGGRSDGRAGFFGAWQGTAPFAVQPLMQWTGRLYDRFNAFFQTPAAPYGVFLRHNAINAGGGVALHRSFVTTFGAGPGARIASIKMTLSHEMVHTFQPLVAGEDADWFNEGIAVFYQARLPLRFGMIEPADYIADINYYAGRYYTNALGNLPNDAIAPGFWRDTRIRTLAYDRGMLYLVTVDRAVRRASGGRRSLDDLVFEMLRAATPVSVARWEAILHHDLGDAGVSAFRAAMAGEAPNVASDAFGPCFDRIAKRLRRYEIGFDPSVLGEPQRIVRGLVDGSAAQQAGLRNGDRIIVPVPQDAIQGEQTEWLTLLVRRGSHTLSITYLPRGAWVESPQWQRVPGRPDSDCAL